MKKESKFFHKLKLIYALQLLAKLNEKVFMRIEVYKLILISGKSLIKIGPLYYVSI